MADLKDKMKGDVAAMAAAAGISADELASFAELPSCADMKKKAAEMEASMTQEQKDALKAAAESTTPPLSDEQKKALEEAKASSPQASAMATCIEEGAASTAIQEIVFEMVRTFTMARRQRSLAAHTAGVDAYCKAFKTPAVKSSSESTFAATVNKDAKKAADKIQAKEVDRTKAECGETADKKVGSAKTKEDFKITAKVTAGRDIASINKSLTNVKKFLEDPANKAAIAKSMSDGTAAAVKTQAAAAGATITQTGAELKSVSASAPKLQDSKGNPASLPGAAASSAQSLAGSSLVAFVSSAMVAALV